MSNDSEVINDAKSRFEALFNNFKDCETETATSDKEWSLLFELILWQTIRFRERFEHREESECIESEYIVENRAQERPPPSQSCLSEVPVLACSTDGERLKCRCQCLCGNKETQASRCQIESDIKSGNKRIPKSKKICQDQNQNSDDFVPVEWSDEEYNKWCVIILLIILALSILYRLVSWINK